MSEIFGAHVYQNIIEQHGERSTTTFPSAAAVAQNRGLADKFTDNFNYPEMQWDLFSNPDSAGPWIAENSSVSQES